MKYRFTGARRDTGTAVDLAIEAAGLPPVKAWAQASGVLWSGIDPLEKDDPARSTTVPLPKAVVCPAAECGYYGAGEIVSARSTATQVIVAAVEIMLAHSGPEPLDIKCPQCGTRVRRYNARAI